MNWEKDGEVPTLKIFHRAKIEIFGPGPLFAPSESLGRPTSIQISSTQCIWVVRIHITCLGPLTDPYDTPGPVLAPKGPFEGPRGTWRARRVQIWSGLTLIGLTGLESWLPDTLTWYLASSGPPGPPKGPKMGPKLNFFENLSCDLSKFAREGHLANEKNLTTIGLTIWEKNPKNY